jgi:hypothetical protein
MPPVAAISATIAAGESLSTPINLTNGTPVALFIPSTWKSARMTFLMSADGQVYGDVFDKFANEISINVEPGTVVQIDPTNNRGAVYMKVRSGSRSLPVIQSVQQELMVFLEA